MNEKRDKRQNELLQGLNKLKNRLYGIKDGYEKRYADIFAARFRCQKYEDIFAERFQRYGELLKELEELLPLQVQDDILFDEEDAEKILEQIKNPEL